MDCSDRQIRLRLRAARESCGFIRAKHAAEAMGVKYSSYAAHENGTRGIRRADIVEYAKFFGVSVEWLEHGIGDDVLLDEDGAVMPGDAREVANRLRAARVQRGFASASAAAAALGVPYGSYAGHENGSRGIKRPSIVKYAEFFDVSVGWLEHGIGEAVEPVVEEDKIPAIDLDTLADATAAAEGAMLAAGVDPALLPAFSKIFQECMTERLVVSSRQSELETRRNLAKLMTSKLLRRGI